MILLSSAILHELLQIPIGPVSGVWLVVIGSAILAVAAGMWVFQGRLKDVKNIINKGFQTVEDGIKDNLLNPNAGIDRAKDTLDQVTGILDQVKLKIQTGKDIVVNNVVPTMHSAATIIRDDAAPILGTSASIIHGVHNTINIGIPNGVGMDDLKVWTLHLNYWHPFQTFANRLHDIDQHLSNIRDKTKDIGDNVDSAANKVADIAQHIDEVANRVQNISDNLKAVIPFVDTNLRNGLQDAVNLLAQTRGQLAQILQLISPQLVLILVIAGVLFIAAGVATLP